mgnify:CR=1 FL=1
MKKWLVLVSAVLAPFILLACPVCEKQQPDILKGITHGAGPQSDWDYVIVWAMVLIVFITLVFSLKWIFRPGEKSTQHIKRLVLKTEDYEKEQ